MCREMFDLGCLRFYRKCSVNGASETLLNFPLKAPLRKSSQSGARAALSELRVVHGLIAQIIRELLLGRTSRVGFDDFGFLDGLSVAKRCNELHHTLPSKMCRGELSTTRGHLSETRRFLQERVEGVSERGLLNWVDDYPSNSVLNTFGKPTDIECYNGASAGLSL